MTEMRNRILIVNVNWLGDVLFSTPFIRTVRQAHPDSYIACLLHPRCREILEGNPRIDEIIIYDEEGTHKGLLGKLKLILLLRNRRFDTAFILHRSFTKALIVALAGLRQRIGYPTKHRSVLLTKTVEEPSEELHKAEYFLNIARACGMRPGDVSYEFFVSERDKKFAEGFLAKAGVKKEDILIALCPGGNWDPKRWPPERFASLADMLIEKYGAKVMITGARSDLRVAEDIKKKMNNPPVMAAGKTTLKELGALLGTARLVIANDTGAMHIAAALGTKVIALFGPTSHLITGPYGRGEYKVIFKNETCEVPCYDFTCDDNRCMSAIKVEDVINQAESMMVLNADR